MNFERIADKYPAERAAVFRLRQLLAASATGRAEYTLNRLCELVQPQSREGLALVLGELVKAGVFKQVVRLVSPATQGGIGEYDSLAEVPEVIHDWRADAEIEVEAGNIRVIYVAQTAASGNGRQRA